MSEGETTTDDAWRRARDREQMIESQIAARGVRDPSVLDAVRAVPRELFVPEAYHNEAYEDRALPIGPNQTISQPYIVAYMTYQLEVRPSDTILEVGTGTGYQAAILARLASIVHTIELDVRLSAMAKTRLEALGARNVHFHVGDGTLGYPPAAPYDRIMVTAGCPSVPPALFEQLARDGIMVVPVGENETQTLLRIARRPNGMVETPLIACRFVRLTGAQGWPDRP